MYPLNDFLKKPALLAEKEKLQSLGLEYDPTKYPHMLPKDDDLARYHYFRTPEDDTFDAMKNEPHHDPELE